MKEKNCGVLLQAIPYLGHGRILKVFTPEAGLLTVITKTASLSHFVPFCIAELVYKKGNRDIYTLFDSSITDPLLELRQSYTMLSSAGSMAQDILRSQLPSKSAQNLYHLLCCYLKKIPQFDNPAILAASFRLKLLIYEGLLTLHTRCGYCNNATSALTQGESVCKTHAPASSMIFNPIEWQILCDLAFSRHFSFLQQMNLPSPLNEKISVLFEERIRN